MVTSSKAYPWFSFEICNSCFGHVTIIHENVGICSYYAPSVLLEIHLLVVEWIEVLVVVHQVVPELVVLGSLPAEQWLLHLLDPHAQLTPGHSLYNNQTFALFKPGSPPVVVPYVSLVRKGVEGDKWKVSKLLLPVSDHLLARHLSQELLI